MVCKVEEGSCRKKSCQNRVYETNSVTIGNGGTLVRVWAAGVRQLGTSACGSLDVMFEKRKSKLYFLKVALMQENVSPMREKSIRFLYNFFMFICI